MLAAVPPIRDRHRADIDGLRAIAVMSVVLFHAGLLPGFAGGYVGVDVFFVISGFLITGIIVRASREGRFSTLDFYDRRIRRIVPALLACMTGCCILSLALLPPKELRDFGQALIAASLSFSNILFWRQADYFAPVSDFKPLLHTWSLGVEEQFYIVWPLLLVAVRRRAPAFSFAVIVALGLASLILSAYAITVSPKATFYWLPTRAWELLMGAALVFIPAGHGDVRYRNALAAIGLAMVAYAVFTFDLSTPFPGPNALVPCIGAALMIGTGAREGESATLVARLLSLKALTFLGLISYSLYLWHWPLLVFARIAANRDLHPGETVLVLALSLAVAWASWRFVETPFRRGGLLTTRRSRLAVGATASAVLAGIGAVFVASQGLPARSPLSARIDAQAREERGNATRSGCLVLGDVRLPAAGDCLVGRAGRDGHDVLIWGDSHAAALIPGLSGALDGLGLRAVQITKSNCPPLLDVVTRPTANAPPSNCDRFNDAAMEFIRSTPAPRAVVLAGYWARFVPGLGIADTREDAYVPMFDRSSLGRTGPGARAILPGALDRTLAAIAETGAAVVVVGQVPEPGFDVADCLSRAALTRGSTGRCDSAEGSRAERRHFVDGVIEAAAGRGAVRAIIPSQTLCRDGICPTHDSERLFYFDDNHLTSAGASRLAGVFQDVLSASLDARAAASHPQMESRQ